MRYDMQTNNDYIVSVTTADQGREEDGNITATKYADIMAAIHSKPEDEDGYTYLLRTDLAWERVETEKE